MFIDPDARPLGELEFGTSEANALQGEGWYGNEEWPGIGPVQWAGDPARRARMQVPVPAHNEALLLHTMSITAEVWVDVTVDGEPGASLQVTDEWVQGYVPLGEALTEPMPEAQPEWTEGRYFPRLPATDRITDPTFDQSSGQVSFRSHGPLQGTAQVSVEMRQVLSGEYLSVIVDGWPGVSATSHNGGRTTVAFAIAQGAHAVQIQRAGSDLALSWGYQLAQRPHPGDNVPGSPLVSRMENRP